MSPFPYLSCFHFCQLFSETARSSRNIEELQNGQERNKLKKDIIWVGCDKQIHNGHLFRIVNSLMHLPYFFLFKKLETWTILFAIKEQQLFVFLKNWFSVHSANTWDLLFEEFYCAVGNDLLEINCEEIYNSLIRK